MAEERDVESTFVNRGFRATGTRAMLTRWFLPGAAVWLVVALAFAPAAMAQPRYVRLERSEERRVGKECTVLCRSRWSPYH